MPARRGFACQATLVGRGQTLARLARRAMRSVPPVTLSCPNLTAATAQAMADAGLLRWVVGLELHGNWAAGLRVLGRHPDAVNIRSLIPYPSITGNSGEAIAAALAGSPYWSGLRDLDLSHVPLDAGPAKELFGAEHLRGLSRLKVVGVNWTVDTTRALAAAFTSLFELRINYSDLTDPQVEVLADSPHLGSLRALDLGHNRIGGRGATAVLASRHLNRLGYLSLYNNGDDDNPIRNLDATALAAAPSGGLRLLHLHACRLTVADVRALARSPRADALWYLDLDENELGITGVRELLRGLDRRCPPVLWLIANRVGGAGAKLIADWPHATNLQVLMLQHGNPLTEAGVDALLASPHLAGLRSLGVPRVSERAVAVVQSRFGDLSRMG